jgi:hypothetical protein
MRLRRSLLILPLLFAACAVPPAESSDTVLGFTPHPGAVEFPSATLDWVDEATGLLALVPVGDCVTGIGSYATDTGTVPVNWSGERGCAKLVLGAIPEGTPGQAVRPVTTAVALADGSIIAAGEKFARRGPGGRATLSALDGYKDTTALVKTGDRLVAIGTRAKNKTTTGPAAWLSDDGGVTSRRIDLPTGGGKARPDVLGVDGDSLLAASGDAATVTLWSSADRGQTWAVSTSPVGEDTTITGVVRAGAEWLVFGGAGRESGRRTPVLLRGNPGGWKLEGLAHFGEGGIVAGTVDKTGNAILLGRDFDRAKTVKRPRYCAAVWVQDGASWERGELGCAEQPPRLVTTLADGRVLIAGNRDLWLR